jgi:hypothetical protein
LILISKFKFCCSDSTFSERYLNSFSLKVANQLPSPSTAISVYMIRTPIYSKHMEVWFKTCFTVFYSPRNENLNLLIRIKFLNLFLYSSKKKTEKIYWSEQRFTGLGLEDRCSSNEKEFKYLSENVESEQHLIKLLNGVIFQILTLSWIDKLQL